MRDKTIIAIMSAILLLLILRYINIQSDYSKDTMGVDNTTEYGELTNAYVSNSILYIEPTSEFLQEILIENKKEDEMAWKERQEQYATLAPELYVEPQKVRVELKEQKIAYLSFDDGPSNVTPTILDTLKEYEVSATFFIITGSITQEGKELLKRMVEEGHVIGIHTNSHKYADIYSSVEAYIEDFNKVFQTIYEVTGVKANIFRFPWGSSNAYNEKIRNELQMEMVRRGFSFYDWNVSAEDSYGKTSAAVIKRNVIKDLDKFQSPIILMHDSSINENTAKVLPEILDTMKEKGFRFSTLDKREPYYFR